MKTKLVWFRNDLRLHDNEPLLSAINRSEQIIPLYIFDIRQFQITRFGFKKTGSFRTQFLLESVQNLRDNLKEIGGNLIVRIGLPEQIIPELCKQYNVVSVYFNKEVAPEEIQVENNVEKELIKLDVNWRDTYTSTLLNKSELPFSIPKLPDVFTAFKTKVEHDCNIQSPLETPQIVRIPEGIESGELPSIAQLNNSYTKIDERAAIQFKGGEREGLKRLHTYLWDRDGLKTYFDTRNGLIGEDYSTKLSPWLALGCISPRQVYQEIKRYEVERIKNKSTYWLTFELLWRDFFHFTMEKQKNKLFLHEGFNSSAKTKPSFDSENFQNWIDGKTGLNFIDANMNELRLTGFMSNRGRQNVASYLINDLKVNWVMGAAYFESLLIDYDVYSNYGNWAYIAGVGNDPRTDRYFNIERQTKVYDAEGKYRALWLS
jgi:deoxyribodipyrimidine photo-lyase